MHKLTLAILGNNYFETTNFVEKIILNTKAKIDQEHIKMNIIINNKLQNKNEQEILSIIKKIEKIDSKYLIILLYNLNIINFIKKNTNLIILNNINEILELHAENIL